MTSFGAAGDGVADDTAALQNAIDSTRSDHILDFGDGTYLCGELTFPDGISWLGRGATLICSESATKTENWIRARGTHQGGTIRGLRFDYQANTHGRHILDLGHEAHDWHIADNTFTGMRDRSAIRADWIQANQGAGSITIEGNEFRAGINAGAIAFYAHQPKLAVQKIAIINNDIVDCGGSMCQVAMVDSTVDDGPGRFGAFKSTVVSQNVFSGNATGKFGAIPLELWGHDDISVSRNRILKATRGIGFGWCRNANSIANSIEEQSHYAYEVGVVNGLRISETVARNCKRFFFEDSDIHGRLSENITIESNEIYGSGMSSPEANLYSIQFAGQRRNAGEYRANITIARNKFSRLDRMTGAIRLVGVRNAVVSGNQLTRVSEPQGIVFCQLTDTVDSLIDQNSVVLSGRYTEATPGFGASLGIISTAPSDLSGKNTVTRNTLESRVFGPHGLDFIGIGASTPPTNFRGLVVIENKLIGEFAIPISVNDLGNTSVVRDNDIASAKAVTRKLAS